MNIGILTGGGDAPGLNAVIRACVKTLLQNPEVKNIYGFRDGFRGLMENQYTLLDNQSVSGILHLGGTILGTTNRDNPFACKEGDQVVDRSGRVKENYEALNLSCLVVIGGDGTLKIAHELTNLGINVVGVPKTIDNDLVLTDLTFGFLSAVSVATEALDRLHTTAESHHRVSILETMGRDAGWIGLYAGVAGGADVILIPEIPFNLDSIYQKIQKRRKKGKKFSLIVMAEGARPKNGDFGEIGKKKVSYYLEEALEERGLETRATILGHLQRGGSPVSYDRIIATQYGYKAAMQILLKDFNKVLVLEGNQISTVDLSRVSGVIKNVPVDHNLVLACRAIGVSFGDEIIEEEMV